MTNIIDLGAYRARARALARHGRGDDSIAASVLSVGERHAIETASAIVNRARRERTDEAITRALARLSRLYDAWPLEAIRQRMVWLASMRGRVRRRPRLRIVHHLPDGDET